MSLVGFHNCSDGIIKAKNDGLLISMDTISIGITWEAKHLLLRLDKKTLWFSIKERNLLNLLFASSPLCGDFVSHFSHPGKMLYLEVFWSPKKIVEPQLSGWYLVMRKWAKAGHFPSKWATGWGFKHLPVFPHHFTNHLLCQVFLGEAIYLPHGLILHPWPRGKASSISNFLHDHMDEE